MYGIGFNNAGNLLAVAAKNHIQLFSRQLEFKFELKDLGHESVRHKMCGIHSSLTPCVDVFRGCRQSPGRMMTSISPQLTCGV